MVCHDAQIDTVSFASIRKLLVFVILNFWQPIRKENRETLIPIPNQIAGLMRSN